jgi:hypothetical protein
MTACWPLKKGHGSMEHIQTHSSFREAEAAALGTAKKLKSVTVRLRPDQVERLKVFAARRHSPETKDVSAIIRLAIDEFFAR